MIRRRKLITEQQAAALIDAARDERFARRDRAILQLLYSTGMRVGELIKLDAGDLDLEAGTVTVLGKGKKRRRVLFGDVARAALRDHLGPRTRGPLFLSREGRRMRARLVRYIVDKYTKKADLDLKASPHTLRHSMASHMLARGAYLFAVKEILGHVHVTTTARYLHPIDNGVTVEDAYRAAHPRA